MLRLRIKSHDLNNKIDSRFSQIHCFKDKGQTQNTQHNKRQKTQQRKTNTNQESHEHWHTGTHFFFKAMCYIILFSVLKSLSACIYIRMFLFCFARAHAIPGFCLLCCFWLLLGCVLSLNLFIKAMYRKILLSISHNLILQDYHYCLTVILTHFLFRPWHIFQQNLSCSQLSQDYKGRC